MFRKIVFALLVVSMLTLPTSGFALAADVEEIQGRRGRFAYGEVVAVREDGFTMETAQGDHVSYLVDDGTRFRRGDVGDLTPGMKVAVASLAGEPRQAKVVVILPDDFDPGGRFAIRVRGEVTAVDPAAGKFRIMKRDGRELTFFVDEDTRYGGQLEELSGLQVGWKAGVAARQEDDGGKRIATLVIAGERPQRFKARGTVTAVDSQAGKFRLKTDPDEVLTFFVDEDTRYGGQLEDLSDLQVGWVAGVAAVEDPEGKNIARWVAAGEKRDRIHARGEITALDAAGKFRLQTLKGDELTFFVDENTRYQGQASTFADLQVGWKAGVRAVEMDGKLVARWIVAGHPRRGGHHPEGRGPFRTPDQGDGPGRDPFDLP